MANHNSLLMAGQTPVEQFNFALSEDWPKWIRRFERFRSVSGLNDKAGTEQINIVNLVNCENDQFQKFAKDWGFIHVTSSPKFPQSNGFIESGVKIIKRCLKKSADACAALLSYRATPLANGFLMGRRIRTAVPVKASLLKPKIPNSKEFTGIVEQRRRKQKSQYEKRHRAKEVKELQVGDDVWIIDLRRSGVIRNKAKRPRSYVIETDKKMVTRNRFHLVPLKQENETDFPDDGWDEYSQLVGRTDVDPTTEVTQLEIENPAPPVPTIEQTPEQVTTRSGRVSKPVQKMNL